MNEHHQRYIATTLRHIDGQFAEIEGILAAIGSPSRCDSPGGVAGHLLLQAWGRNGTYGAIEIQALFEAKFFDIDNGAEVTFMRNKEGVVTSMVTRCELLDFDGNFGRRPDYEGKKVQ